MQATVLRLRGSSHRGQGQRRILISDPFRSDLYKPDIEKQLLLINLGYSDIPMDIHSDGND